MAKEIVNVIYQDDGIYVSISQAAYQSGLTWEALQQELAEQEVRNYSDDLLRRVWTLQSSEKTCIYRLSATSDLDQNITLTITPDRMSAQIKLDFTPGFNPTKLDMLNYLAEKGIVFGVNEDQIDNILAEMVPGESVEVARGEPAIDGYDAKLEFLFNVEQSTKPLVLDNGNVDYRQIENIQCVKEGEALVRKEPAYSGKRGMTIAGLPLPAAPGRDLPIPVGQNTVAGEGDTVLTAVCQGHVLYKEQKVHVQSVFVDEGNVDFQSGNISFPGDVIIKGDVLTGFEVVATGNITVMGNVEGAHLLSKSGGIEVLKGVVGQNKAQLRAATNVTAKYFQDCTVAAGYDVKSERYILNSLVTAGRQVLVDSAKGSIIGGEVVAISKIKVAVLGSTAFQKTVVAIRKISESEVENQLYQNRRRLVQIIDSIRKKERRLEFFELLYKRLKRISQDKVNEAKAIGHQMRLLMAAKRQIEEKIKEIESQRGHARLGYVVADLCVHPESFIRIDNITKKISERISGGGTFKLNDSNMIERR